MNGKENLRTLIEKLWDIACYHWCAGDNIKKKRTLRKIFKLQYVLDNLK